jgi:hypothetical protein
MLTEAGFIEATFHGWTGYARRLAPRVVWSRHENRKLDGVGLPDVQVAIEAVIGGKNRHSENQGITDRPARATIGLTSDYCASAAAASGLPILALRQ